MSNLKKRGKQVKMVGGLDISTYNSIHAWLRYHYVKGNVCEGAECSGVCKIMHFALRQGKKYEKNRENFIVLCFSCHKKYDMTDETRKKMSESRMGVKMSPETRNRMSFAKSGSNHPFFGKHLSQEHKEKKSVKVFMLTKGGAVLKKYNSLVTAAEEQGILKTSIINSLKGRSKTAGGFKWKYAE